MSHSLRKHVQELRAAVARLSCSGSPHEVSVKVKSLYGWGPKLQETMGEIRDGKLSYSSHEPLRVSRLDSPRGAFFILDGHHRAVEAAFEDKDTVKAIIDVHVPRIERTGGAHRDVILEKIRVIDALRAFSPRKKLS